MPLEDPEVIDIIARPESGKLELVISDGGVTTEPRARLEKLIEKLKGYIGYILSEDFAQEYPELGPDDVSIAVVCATEPTPEMLSITHIRPRVEPTRLIPVKFSLFDGEKFTPLEPQGPPTVDKGRILPRLITKDFLARVPADELFPHRPLDSTGLFVAYVLDSDNSVMYVMGAMVEELGLSEPELHELALANLAQTFPPESLRQAVLNLSGITTIKYQDSFDAARLLLLPQALQPGQVVAAIIPDRDTLALLPVPEGGNWTPLTKLAGSPASDHLLLDRPLRVTSSGFEVM